MIFTINPEKSLIEVSKDNLSNSDLEVLTEISKKFPTYKIKLLNSLDKNSGGNGGCGCGGKCNGKLHQLLNKEIFHLKSRVLSLETKSWSPYVNPYEQQIYCKTNDVTNKLNSTGYIEVSTPYTTSCLNNSKVSKKSSETTISEKSAHDTLINDCTQTAIFLATTQASF